MALAQIRLGIFIEGAVGSALVPLQLENRCPQRVKPGVEMQTDRSTKAEPYGL